MRVLIQRCKNGFCDVDGKRVGSIDKGLVLLVGFTDGDSKETIDWMVNKICNLRIFPDKDGVMNLSILDVEEKVLSISQFTLYADTKKVIDLVISKRWMERKLNYYTTALIKN